MTDKQVKEEALEMLNKASEMLEQIADDDTLCALGGVIEEVGDIEV
jgi:hypothetical protein